MNYPGAASWRRWRRQLRACLGCGDGADRPLGWHPPSRGAHVAEHLSAVGVTRGSQNTELKRRSLLAGSSLSRHSDLGRPTPTRATVTARSRPPLSPKRLFSGDGPGFGHAQVSVVGKLPFRLSTPKGWEPFGKGPIRQALGATGCPPLGRGAEIF